MKDYFNQMILQRISKNIKDNQRIMCIKWTFAFGDFGDFVEHTGLCIDNDM